MHLIDIAGDTVLDMQAQETAGPFHHGISPGIFDPAFQTDFYAICHQLSADFFNA
jgi:hypothetical protein